MLRNVSHDLRAPLNSMIQNLELLQGQVSSDLAGEYIEPALCSGKILMNLLNDILDLSQLRAGKFNIVNQIFDIRELIRDIIKIQRIVAQNKGLALVSQVSENVPQLIKSDPNRIKQIIINLVNNAIKYELPPCRPSFDIVFISQLNSFNPCPPLTGFSWPCMAMGRGMGILSSTEGPQKAL